MKNNSWVKRLISLYCITVKTMIRILFNLYYVNFMLNIPIIILFFKNLKSDQFLHNHDIVIYVLFNCLLLFDRLLPDSFCAIIMYVNYTITNDEIIILLYHNYKQINCNAYTGLLLKKHNAGICLKPRALCAFCTYVL